MRTIRSLEPGRTTLWAIGAAAALTLSACSGSTDRLTAPVSSRTSTIARWDAIQAGFINVCKASGPAGTYSFAISVSGGGHYYTGQGPNDHTNPTVNFDGTNLVCTRAFTVIADGSWADDTKGDVTITELLPAGVNAAEIKVFNPRVLPEYQYSVFDTPTITLTVGPTDRRKVQYYNVRKDTPPPVVANCVEITAVKNVAITPVQLTASGGNGGPYTFGATGLPAGLSLSSDGILSGTPTVTGTFNYTVTVEDTDGNSATSGSCAVRVSPPPRIVANCVEIAGDQDVAITPVQLTASGGNGGPYTFSATGLPDGLTLSSSGLLSGTPTVSGTFNYTVTVTDSDGNTGTSGSCAVTVNPPSIMGRMTGGGRQIDIGGLSITRGFTIHCDITLSNNIEINWAGGNNWHLDKPIKTAICLDDPTIDETPPRAPFNTFIGTAVGKLNGVDGARLEFTFIDAGEPGRNDRASFKIWDVNNNLVLDLPLSALDHGNIQAHYDQPHGSNWNRP